MQPEYQSAISWLLKAKEPWVVYNTMRDLSGEGPDRPAMKSVYQDLQQHPAVGALFESLASWPSEKPLKGAYDPKDSIWKLGTLADFGLQRDDPRIKSLAERVFAAQAEDGGFLHGGFDHTRTWDTRSYICIGHVMTYALARFGYLGDPRLDRAYDQLLAWQRRDGGWHPNKLNLPGQSREAEPSCPFGTLNVLRAMVANPALSDGDMAQRGANFLLECWERRAEPYRPVGFGTGSTWDKVQYPFVQYQILKTLDTLALIKAVHPDPRFQDIVAHLKSKRDGAGYWTAEGINKPYGEFDFGQKKQSSPWLTYLALRVLVRASTE